MDEPSHLSKYVKMFEKEMGAIDPLQQVVLKGHLIIETALDSILLIIFFHPEHILRGRFTFTQKIQLARAYGLRKDKNTIWNLILSINEVRNEVAHNLAGERRNKKLKQLRRLYLTEISYEMRKAFEESGINLDEMLDEEAVAQACFLCTGYLGAYENDVASLRSFIDALDRDVNPDQIRVPRSNREDARNANGRNPGSN